MPQAVDKSQYRDDGNAEHVMIQIEKIKVVLKFECVMLMNRSIMLSHKQ